MTRLRKGNRDLIKDINRNLVLNLIKNQGPISRTDLARISRLSPATISNITADFIADDIVHDIGEGLSSGGRRPVMLRLNHRAGFVVGLKLMENTISIALTDLDAQVLHHRLVIMDIDAVAPSPNIVITHINQAIEETILATKVERERLMGIGIGMAGSVDGEKGICRFSPFFNWRNVSITEPIAMHFDLPVYLENDVNTLTIAEKWFGYGHDSAHFIVTTVGRGIGAGIVVNNQFYRGALGGAGEIGHITLIDGDSPRTLEALASDPAVIARVETAVANNTPTSLANSADISIASITAAADNGDSLAQQVLADAGRWLGIGIATLINILNPQCVIVAGEGVAAGKWRLDPMRVAIKAHTFNGLANELDIFIEPSGDETWARGAATLVLDELFKSPIHRDTGRATV